MPRDINNENIKYFLLSTSTLFLPSSRNLANVMTYYKSSQIVYNRKFYENVTPIKVTESKKLEIYTDSWGIITDYYLESIKINSTKGGLASTVATLKIGDVSGQVVGIVRGYTVGTLFNFCAEEWSEVEQLCNPGQQLFYRYFKDGLKSTFSYEQKIFYHFCAMSQKSNVFVAVFRKGINQRNIDKNEAFLEILDLKKCEGYILDLYTEHLRKTEMDS